MRSGLPLGKGSFHTDLLVDFSPGGSCNIVAESDVFASNNGAIFAQSHHADCATFGLRIDTTFQVTGAPEPSRARAGAAGSLARTRGSAARRLPGAVPRPPAGAMTCACRGTALVLIHGRRSPNPRPFAPDPDANGDSNVDDVTGFARRLAVQTETKQVSTASNGLRRRPKTSQRCSAQRSWRSPRQRH